MPRFAKSAMLAAAALAAASAVAQPARQASHEAEDRALARWTSPALTTFQSEAEFRRYLADARAAARARRMWWADGRRIQFAQAAAGQAEAGQPDTQEPLCPPDDPACAAADEGSIAVTGSRVRSANARASTSGNPSITNTQEAGVDEGDIVKQIGQFLLILQDGRIFVVDTRAGNGRSLALTDRVNVYRNRNTGAWYDEMLVQDDRVVVTAYSYSERATEISVFRLDARGRLSSLGVFYMSSNDYYDTDNYATRLVGDRLVVYSPMGLRGLSPDSPIPWPLVRRWTEGEERQAALARGVRLFDARTIYRPVRTTYEPVVHTVSVCPLGPAGSGGDLACRTTAFIGPPQREYYVSPTDAYLWISPGYYEQMERRGNQDCPAGTEVGAAGTMPALLYRLPLSGAAPGVIGTAGVPIDQFSLAAINARFRALVRWPAARCRDLRSEPRLAYFNASLARFGRALAEAPPAAYTPVPLVGATQIENRFTDHYLVYGGRSSWGTGAPDEDDGPVKPARIVAVPVDRPQGAVVMPLSHSVIRAERAGDNIVLTGYRGRSGLDISLVDLRAAPRVASTVRLRGRYESEGRSHAFNSLIEADGSGLMGLPTVVRDDDSQRFWWRSRASDLSYLRVNAAGRLIPIGELTSEIVYDTRNDRDGIAGYECEVSCIDWYGNSRPIFTDGRIFGLTGTELVEGRIWGGRIREIARLNIAVPRR